MLGDEVNRPFWVEACKATTLVKSKVW
jgi:hypothetical protein